MLDLFLPKKAQSHRQQRVAEEIRQIVAHILQTEDLPIITNENGENIKPKSPITITYANVSPDLKHALIGVMPLGGIDQDLTEEYMHSNVWFIKKKMAKQLKLRSVPEIKFKLDIYFEQSERIDSIINENKVH